MSTAAGAGPLTAAQLHLHADQLMFLALIASTVGYALLLARLCRWRPEETLLPVTATIVGLLYALVFVGLLRGGSHVILVGGWIAFLVVLWRARRADRATIADILTPGLLVFIASAILLWLKLRTASYAHWDEFSHWGLVTKVIAADPSLPSAQSAVYFKAYPPGTALWHYFATRIVPYSEGAVYFAHHLMVLSGFVMPLRSLGWRQWPLVLAGMGSAYLAIFAFGHGFQSLLVEHVLGVFFGSAVLWYVAGDGSRARLGAMAPVLFCMPLLKEGGQLFAGLACAIVISVELVRLVRARGSSSGAALSRRRFAPLLLAFTVLPAAPLAASETWAAHTRTLGIEDTLYSSSMTFSRIRRTLSAQPTDRDRIILPRFRDAFTGRSVGNSRLGALGNTLLARAGLLPLVPNGDFSAGLQDWDASGAHLRVNRGRLAVKRAAEGTVAMASTRIVTEANHRYAASCAHELGTAISTTLRIRAGADVLAEATGTARSGRLSVEFTATGSATTLDIYLVSPPGLSAHAFFDDVRVVEIGGPVTDTPEGAAMASPRTTRPPLRWPSIRPFVERPVSTAAWALIFVLVSFVLWRVEDTPDGRLLIAATSCWLAVGLVIFLLALLFVYLYGLADYDARALASYERYVGTFFIGWALVIIGAAAHATRCSHRRAASVVIASVLLLMLMTAPGASADWLLDDQRVLPVRMRTRALVAQVDRHVPFDRSVSILWQQTQGFEFWILRYELAPRATNQWNFAFGPPYSPGDVWTNDVSDGQFLETISAFDYLLVGHADGPFWSRYGHLFEPAARGLTSALFEIEQKPSGGVGLRIITPL